MNKTNDYIDKIEGLESYYDDIVPKKEIRLYKCNRHKKGHGEKCNCEWIGDEYEDRCPECGNSFNEILDYWTEKYGGYNEQQY